MTIKFADIKQDLLNALATHPECKDFYLIEGFVNFQMQDEINGSFKIGGPTIPSVLVFNNVSKNINIFPIKVLLPDINLDSL